MTTTNSIKYIKNSRPVVSGPPVTGAALRAVEAANAAAIAVYDHLDSVQDAMIAHDATPQDMRDAVWCAEALRLAKAESAAILACQDSVVKRWSSTARNVGVAGRAYLSYEWPAYIENWSRILRDAGVPMPVSGCLTVEYWQDAAARGC